MNQVSDQIIYHPFEDFLWVTPNCKGVVNVKKYVLIVIDSVVLSCLQSYPQIRVSKTRFLSHLFHTISQMISEQCTGTFNSVQCPNNHIQLPSVRCKIWPQDGVNLFLHTVILCKHSLCLQFLHLDHVTPPSSKRSLLSHGTQCQTCDGLWGVGNVTASNHPRLLTQVLHIHIEDHMALDELMTKRQRVPFLLYAEDNLDVLCIFRNVIIPKSVALFLVQIQILINCLWKLNPELHCCLYIFLRTALPDFSDDWISFILNMLHPPVKHRLVINLLHHQVLLHIQQVAFFLVRQTLLGCALVFPDNTNLPTSRQPFLAVSSIQRYMLILQRHCPF